MKKVSIIVASLLLSASMCLAQENAQARIRKTPEQRAELITQRMSDKLTLTEDQTKKMKEVHLAQAKKMDELRAGQQETRKAFQQEVKSVHTKTDEQYKSILTPEQYQKYLQLKEERASKQKNKPNAGRRKN